MKSDFIKEEVKTIGKGGQIYLGKEFAGQHVLVTQERQGVWIIKTAAVIPHDEQWAHNPENAAKITAALEWANSHPAKASSPEELDALLEKASG